MERLEQFYQDVLTHIPRATGRERNDIRQELADHLEDRMEVYLELGCDRAEAERRAVTCMGDPAEIGRAWNKELSVFWHGVEIACKCVVVVLAVLLLFRGGEFFYGTTQGLSVRNAGRVDTRWPSEQWELVQSSEQEANYEFGRHVVRLYQTELIREGDREVLGLYFLTYPKNLFHQALNISSLVVNSRMEPLSCNGQPPCASQLLRYSDNLYNYSAWGSFFYLEEGTKTALVELEIAAHQLTIELELDELEVIA